MKDWLVTFWQILILPTPKTFAKESEKAENKFGGAIGWAVFVAIYLYSISIISGNAFHFTTLIVALFVIPLGVVFASSTTHFMLQRFFHRKQYLYDKVLYIYTAIFTLFQIIITPVTFFAPTDASAVINYILVAYQFVLFVIATKTIGKIKYWQAAITVLCAILVGVITFICAFPVIISLMEGVNRTMR